MTNFNLQQASAIQYKLSHTLCFNLPVHPYARRAMRQEIPPPPEKHTNVPFWHHIPNLLGQLVQSFSIRQEPQLRQHLNDLNLLRTNGSFLPQLSAEGWRFCDEALQPCPGRWKCPPIGFWMLSLILLLCLFCWGQERCVEQGFLTAGPQHTRPKIAGPTVSGVDIYFTSVLHSLVGGH